MATAIDKISSYTAEDIQVLEGLDPVRKRPGMYIGSTDLRGLQHLVTAIVNNSMDEAIAGFANHIKVEFFKDGSVAVYDNGRGVPYDIKKGYGVSALELAFTKLHAGGKFGGGSYKVSSGLHGVGVSVVNALSKKLHAEVYKDGFIYTQDYELGVPLTPIKKGDKTDKSGTTITFYPDEKIFETVVFEFDWVADYLRHQAYLTKGIKAYLCDERTN